MVSFPTCTLGEADRVLATMAECGLERGREGLEVYTMCEIPSNVYPAEAHVVAIKIGICDQAPSNYPEFTELLVGQGIDSIFRNPHSLVTTIRRVAEMKRKLGARTDGAGQGAQQ